MSITQQDVSDLWVGTTPGTAPPTAAENERILQILNQHRNDHAHPDNPSGADSRSDR